MGGCVGGCVGQWVNGWGQVITKYWINLDVIEIIQFCLKIYDLIPGPFEYFSENGGLKIKVFSMKEW